VAQADAENTKFLSAVGKSGTFVQERKGIAQSTHWGTYESTDERTVSGENWRSKESKQSPRRVKVSSIFASLAYLIELKTKGSPTGQAKAMICRAAQLLGFPMRYINLHFTYLLTYLLRGLCRS